MVLQTIALGHLAMPPKFSLLYQNLILCQEKNIYFEKCISQNDPVQNE